LTYDMIYQFCSSADGDYVVTKMTKATISPNGGVSWSPPAIFKSHCDIDVEFFPFDMQYCWLKFGIWSYSATEIDIKHSQLKTANDTEWVEEGIDLSAYYHSVEWALIRVSAQKHIVYYPCCEYPFNDLTFYITLRRKTLFYTINLIIPCVSITLLTLLEFYLPSDCGEKISLCISVLLSLSLFQLLLLEIIPPTSIKVPLVGKYILLTTIFVSLSVMFTVLILNINFRRDTSHEMPRWMKRLFLDFLPRYLWMRRPIHIADHEDMDFEQPCSDLSNYENPYKEKFRPLYKEMSTENLFHKVSFNTTFIGMANLDMANYCQVPPPPARNRQGPTDGPSICSQSTIATHSLHPYQTRVRFN
jgi:nicotinic acetylcholine receptor